MARKEMAVDSVAEAYLALLAERGVEYLFANAGTDFAPLVEAFAKAARTGAPVPKPVLATHENLALSMAHGYAMVTGRVPAVMVHVSVGTANGVCAAFNAARENVPMLFTAGRSPLTEDGHGRARATSTSTGRRRCSTRPGWCARSSNGITNCATASSSKPWSTALSPSPPARPQGPVYLSLPREVLAAPLPGFAYDMPVAPRRRLAARSR